MAGWNSLWSIKIMNTLEKIAFVDLHAQHAPLLDEIHAAVHEILSNSSFIGGAAVSRFEAEFAQYLGVQEVIGVGNGTDALWLALAAEGIGPGDAVITAPNTFIATVEAITRSGAHPLFVDIDIETDNLSPQALGEFLANQCKSDQDGNLLHTETGSRVAAVMPVHLYGLPADVQAISQICEQYRLTLIEDACQAHGAKIKMNGDWKRAGTFGSAAGFSFYPGKNLGAIGDAGAVVTNSPEAAAKMRELRNHGSSEKYIHTTQDGWNARLDSIQAAVLSIKLRHLDEWNKKRRQAAEWYREGLAGLPLELPCEPPGYEHVYHLYVVRTEQREELRKGLLGFGIETGIHYPIPLHRQQAYSWMDLPEGSFPNAERSARTVLSLPMHPYIDQQEVERVCEACKSLLSD
jgi:dTDP-4-amino-4,6-dideoxygalactose transaminase